MKFKNLQGEEFKVELRKPDKRTWGEDCDGVCIPSQNKIYINPYRGNKTKLNTSIHEFTHAFFWDKTEKEVTQFANTVTKFLYKEGWRNNRW